MDSISIRRTYKYRLYSSKRDRHLHDQINIAGLIWNHALALQKRYYRLTGKYIFVERMRAHTGKLRMKTQRFAHWKLLGSQTVQDVCNRLDKAYQRFFTRLASSPPHFKKVKSYRSFTLTQYGWKLITSNQNQLKPNGEYTRERGMIKIGDQTYKFVQHRPLGGEIKTVTVKRDAMNRLWLCFSVIERIVLPEGVGSSRIGGFDFGLRTFLTDEQGRAWMHPEFFRQALGRVRRLNHSLARKQADSQNRKVAKWLLARAYERVADKRQDFHFKLAHALCDDYDVLVFEDLNLRGMTARWGRKVNDLAFGKFLYILEHVARKRGKQVIYSARYERTTGKCSQCGHVQTLTLDDRTFHCGACDLVMDRDHNAARNILRAGASAHTGLGVVRPASAGGAA
jgi:putative transposase